MAKAPSGPSKPTPTPRPTPQPTPNPRPGTNAPGRDGTKGTPNRGGDTGPRGS